MLNAHGHVFLDMFIFCMYDNICQAFFDKASSETWVEKHVRVLRLCCSLARAFFVA